MCRRVNLFNKIVLAFTICSALIISGCGGSGGGGGSTSSGPGSQSVTGGGVKGPLAFAVVNVYSFDSSQPGFKSASAVATASTDANAAITGMALPFPLNPPYIMEFTSTAGTTIDITTGAFPVITTMRTVITQSLLDGGEQVYATPLTTMATDIAVANAQDTNGTAGIQADEFEAALTAAASQVVSTLGFGLDSSVDIFDVPPLVDNTTDTTEEQTDVAAYRAAVEAVTAIAFQIDQQTSGGDTDSVLAELAADLADGGGIDGSAGTEINTNTLQVLEQDPSTLPIPNSPTNQTVADVQDILVTEAATTAPTTPVTELDAGGSISTEPAPAETDPDLDNDGVLNADDAYPNDATADTDTDGDGAPDIAYTDGTRITEDTVRSDADDDNDGWLDIEDDFPVDATAFLDPALDRDSDTVLNGDDNCPLNSNTDQTDTDGDGTGDVCSNDNDGDGVDDGGDNCPVNANPAQTDTDTDGTGDVCDDNIDGDSEPNVSDAFPLDDTEQVDTDGDGIGDNADADDDNDGVLDGADTGLSPLDGTTACSLLNDCDGDGYLDGIDSDPLNALVNVNFAPVAEDGAGSTDEDAPVSITVVGVFATDSNGDALTITSVGTPANGMAVINGDNIDYTPDADFNGTDSFSYTVNDGTVSDSGSIEVTVNPVNDEPVVDVVGPFSVSESATNGTIVGTVTASDIDSAVTGYSIAGGNTGSAFAIDAAGQITVNDTTVIDYESATSFTLTITATDGSATSAGQEVTVNVDDANDTAPVVGTAGPFNVDEDAANATVVGTVPASDIDTVGSVTGFSITNGNTGAAFAINAAGQITVNDTTAIDFETSASFVLTVTATDGVNVSSGQAVTVDINDVNDIAPVVTAGQSFDVAEDAANTAVVGTVLATDADAVGSITNFSIDGGNTGAAFAIDANGQITVNDTAAIDFETATSFTLSVTATDGTNTSVTEDVTINVSDANDTAPVVTPAQSFNVVATAAVSTVIGTVAATDVDTVGSITGYAITLGDAGELAIDNNGQITVISALTTAAGGAYNLTVTATDGTNTSAGETVTVNVVNNTPPVIDQAGPLSVTMDEDGSPVAFVAPTVTATDAENDSLSWSTPGAGNGTATVTGSGTGSTPTITYVPDADFNGSDSFVVNVFDGTSTVGITVDVTIDPQNDAPTITGTPSTVATEGAPYSFIPGGGDIDVGAVLTYSISGQPSWATTFDTATGELSGTPQAGDAGPYNNIIISVSDGIAPPVELPAFNITVGTGVDITGVWNFTFTSDPASDVPANCSGTTPGDTDEVLITMKQTGTDLALTALDGSQLTGGTINTDTGVFSISGVLSETLIDLNDNVDPIFEDATNNETVSLAGTGSTGSTITGTITADNGAGCVEAENVSATFIYKHSGTGVEDYSGVYAFEILFSEENSDNVGVVESELEGFPFELEFVGTTVNVHFPDELNTDINTLETEDIINNTFDPATGYFTFTILDTRKEEFDDFNPGFDRSSMETLVFHGIFVGDPATTPGGSGAPVVFVNGTGTAREYDGDFDTTGTLVLGVNEWLEMYGKRLTTTGITRTNLVERGNQADVMQVRLGLQAPPLRRVDVVNSKLHMQVLDGSTILCEGPFADDGTGTFLYDEQINQPNPDFNTLQFRSGPYSSATCNTSTSSGVDQVINGQTYKIRIIDTGIDGVLDTANGATAVNDDLIVFDSDVDFAGGYQAEVAIPADRYTETPNVFDITVNGARTSRTMGGSLLTLYGYFDASESINVSWTAQEAITENYQLRIRNVGDFIINRYGTSGLSVDLPPYALSDYDANRLNLFARDRNTSVAGAEAWSVSRGIEVNHGVVGTFNLELGTSIDASYRTMQVYLEGGEFGMTCIVINNPNVFCNDGFVDFGADIVTLNMTDISGGLVGVSSPFTLDLHFKPDGATVTSGRAVVTSPGVAGIPTAVDVDPVNWVTEARAVNAELEIRSQRMSNGNIRSLVVGINPIGDGTYELGTFTPEDTATIFTTNVAMATDTDTLDASQTLWDDAIGGMEFFNLVDQFVVVPTDDNNSQIAGRLFFLSTQPDWGYGWGNVLKAGTYKAVAVDIDGIEPNVVFRKEYAGNDPSAYIAPTIDDVDVELVNAASTTNCISGVSCTSGTPVDTGASDAGSFNLVWTVTTPPVESRWGLFVTNLSTGEETRTRRMIPDDVDSEVTSVDNGDGTTTYTWTNPGDIAAPVGQTLEINIVVTSGENGSRFSNVGVMIPADRVHVTQQAL